MVNSFSLSTSVLPSSCFRFSLQAKGAMILPPYKGAAFRGALSNGMRRLVCASSRKECNGCDLISNCLYAAVFEPGPPRNHPEAGKFATAPVPYVLTPPLSRQQAFRDEERLFFDLTLIGPAQDALPYLIYSAQSMGKRGFGHEKNRFNLLQVDKIENGCSAQVYDGASQTLLNADAPSIPVEPEQKSGIQKLALEFLTPLRIKVRGDLATDLNFALFFENLGRRISLLSSFYGNNGNCPDPSDLLEKSRTIQTLSSDLVWYDWQRWSSRQKDAMKLGGLIGKIAFEGDLGPFVPWLRLGELVHVGQSTSFGLGKYMMIKE